MLVISLAALLASALTLFSGFGLGTLLMPVVALFFPVDVAVAITAVVHLANNLFKVGLLGRMADREVLLRFGLPAMASAFVGALLLAWLAASGGGYEYQAFGRTLKVTPLKLVIGALILLFVVLELSPRFAALSVARRYLPVGGVISGFFGGLSGHQGAFRSMFLIKAGLDKEAFVATGVMIAVLVDVARLLVYGGELALFRSGLDWSLVGAACLSAFLGAWLGAKLLQKVTLRSVRLMVSVLLVLVALGMIAGLL